VPHRIYREGKVHVQALRCPTCIFWPDNRMDLRPGRLRDLIQQARRGGDAGTVVCHETLEGREQAVCRGFFDLGPKPSLLQIAERMGFLEFDQPG
jgi:hypothetical protein